MFLVVSPGLAVPVETRLKVASLNLTGIRTKTNVILKRVNINVLM